MTPREKAKDLIEWYAEELPPVEFGVLMERDWCTAKKCAIYTMDNILEGKNLLRLPLSYWEGVKKEGNYIFI